MVLYFQTMQINAVNICMEIKQLLLKQKKKNHQWKPKYEY